MCIPSLTFLLQFSDRWRIHRRANSKARKTVCGYLCLARAKAALVRGPIQQLINVRLTGCRTGYLGSVS